MNETSLWELGEDAKKLKVNLIGIETNKKKYKQAIHDWIINHLFDSVRCEDIAFVLSKVFDKPYNTMLTAVNARKQDVDKRIAASKLIKLDLDQTINKKSKPMTQVPKVMFYTQEQTEEMISILKTGDVNINELSRQLAVKYGRTIYAVRFKLHGLKKKLNLTKNSQLDKVKVKKVINNPEPLNFEPVIQQPADIGVEVPHGMTFEGKPKKIMLHSDHFRIYF